MDSATNVFKINLQKLPDCNNDEFYRMADYIELKALADLDGFYAKKDFISDAKKRSEDLGEGDFESNKKDKDLSAAARNDKWESFADDVYRVLESRIHLFKGYYPFSLTENNSGLTYKGSKSIKKQYYLFLLFCSNLKYTIRFKKQLTSSFEAVSVQVLKSLFPSNSEIKLFGSSNTETKLSEWSSNKLWDKLQWLAKFMNTKLLIDKADIGRHDMGDRGLDIIGKIILKDNLSHFPIIFAQCACSPNDWINKQHSTSKDAWNQLITFNNDPKRFMFIPQSYRNANFDWHDKTKIYNNILMDRRRILDNFTDENMFKKASSYDVVQRLIATKESTI